MSQRLFERLLRAVFAAHKVAAEECAANFKPSETDNILGSVRRAELEGFMRDTADMEGIGARVVRSRLSLESHRTAQRTGRSDGQFGPGPVRSRGGSRVPADPCTRQPGRPLAGAWYEPPADSALRTSPAQQESRLHRDDQLRYGHLPGSAYPGSRCQTFQAMRTTSTSLRDSRMSSIRSCRKSGIRRRGPLPAQRAQGRCGMRAGTPGFSGQRLREAREARGYRRFPCQNWRTCHRRRSTSMRTVAGLPARTCWKRLQPR